MSVEIYDLAQRLRAALEHAPVPRAVYAPCLPPVDPVAVVLERVGREPVLHAASAAGEATGAGSGALGALRALGVTLGDSFRTLVVPDVDTLAALARLARDSPVDDEHAEQAAVVAWWDQRGDHPGSSAVLFVADACARRWVLGTAPAAERLTVTWSSWLGVTSSGPCALLELAERVAAGPSLPGLDEVAGADERSWSYHRERLSRGWDWRRPDSRVEAALGLASRADAAELYESLRLHDPLVALREAQVGNVITGRVVQATKRGPLVIESSQRVCRLRADTEVQGWVGTPVDAPGTDRPRVTGVLAAVTVSAAQTLTLTLRTAATRNGSITVGDPMTLRSKAAEPHQQRHGRGNLGGRYRSPHNWLATATPPEPRRREVPLDIVIAAADDI